MRRLREIILRLGGLFNKQRKDRELEAEIESHIQMHRGLPVLETLWQDIRYGARVLCKAPSFTIAAILTLAVGIDFNSSVFSLVHSMFLRTMPIRDASSVALLFNQDASGTSPFFSYFDYSFYRENARTFRGLVAAKREDPYLDETGRRVLVDFVSDNYLSVLGVGPDLPDQPLVVISQRLWKSHFNTQGFLFRESLGQGQRLLLRVDRDIPGALQLIRAEAARIDPKFRVELSTIERTINLSVWPSRVAAAISSAVGLVALALASIGIYGSISYQVSQRKKEMAIRLALGSPNRQLIQVILNQSMRTVLLGPIAGIAGALAASRALGQLLYGLNTFDPPAFLTASLALISVALLATYLPARRAARVDPMEAVRYE